MLSVRYPEIPGRCVRIRSPAREGRETGWVQSSTAQGWCAAWRRVRGKGAKPVFGVDAIWCADSTDRPSSTRSTDPWGGDVDREGVTTSCTFVNVEPPQGFNEDPELPISGKKKYNARQGKSDGVGGTCTKRLSLSDPLSSAPQTKPALCSRESRPTSLNT